MAEDKNLEPVKVEETKTEQPAETYEGLEKQVQAEYTLAWDHQKPRIDEWLVRLKLYNNQKRDKDAVGDTTLFTIFQTVLASLYVDRLNTEWGAREEGDEEVAENLNAMAQYDYDEMGKDEIDHEWDWDTIFFGRGFLALSEYIREPDKNIFLPAPEVLDPVTLLRDPRASSINGNRLLGRNAARFFGREIKMTRRSMESNPNFFKNIDWGKLKYGSGTKSLIADAEQARAAAQGFQATQKNKGESELRENAEYDITEWHTHCKIGGTVKKVKCWLGNERKYLVGVKVLKDDIWPVIDRVLYPSSHDWDGTSIPDITEDKQRARAIAQNLGLKAMMADLYPMYIYDQNKIKNRHDLDFAYNKFIPSDGDVSGAVFPLRKAMPNLNLLDFIYSSLDVAAQKATATPELQQGAISQEQRTLGEINLIASKVETRYGLSAKIFGWSEKRFWLQWYKLYKDNFKEDIDEKVLRIVGAFGPKWRPLTREQIITKRVDPDVKIESLVMSRAKQLEERQAMSSYIPLALSDPTTNRRYGLKKLGELNGMKKDEIERLFPPTIDERIAEDENDKLSDNKFVEVQAEDDHNVHLEVHSKASATKATYAHIETHKKALSWKKTNPELFPADQQTTNFTPAGTPGLSQPAGTPAGQAIPMGAKAAVAPSQTSGQPMPYGR